MSHLLTHSILEQYRFIPKYTGIKEGLVGCWEFDETSGTTAYNSHVQVPRYHGIIDGATINQTGKVWKCYSFDKVDDLVNLQYCKDDQLFSFSAWVYLRSYGEANGRIFNKTGIGWQHLASADSSIPLYFEKRFSGGSNAWKIPFPGLNMWFHISITYDGSLYTNIPLIYINGSLSSLTKFSSGTGTSLINTGAWIIGNRILKDRTFDGYIDQVAIWKRLITATEVSAIYNSGNGLAYSSW